MRRPKKLLLVFLHSSQVVLTLVFLYIVVAEAPDGNLMGYMLGKSEGEGKLWHGHVSAVTVSKNVRRDSDGI